MASDYTTSERTDVPEDGSDIVVTQGQTQNAPDDLGDFGGSEWIETEEEGWNRTHGLQVVPDEYKGFSRPGDERPKPRRRNG